MDKIKVTYNPQLLIPERKAALSHYIEGEYFTLLPGLNYLDPKHAEMLGKLAETDVEIKDYLEVGVLVIDTKPMPDPEKPLMTAPDYDEETTPESNTPPLPAVSKQATPVPTDISTAAKVKQTPSK